MTRSIVFIIILVLTATGAFAQALLFSPPPVETPAPPVRGSTPGTPTTGGSTDVSAVHGRPGGVERIQDPYGTSAAASLFGRLAGVDIIQDPSRSGPGTQHNPYP